jgi:pimeloyl-ACP methyl ester carboxylesterase
MIIVTKRKVGAMSDAPITASRFDESGKQIATRSGPVAYVDTGGELPVALFVHGIATSSTLWRGAIDLLQHERRCIAIDLPLHGRTPAPAGMEFSLATMAGVITDLCDALGLTQFDLVANDTGGAIAQVFAVQQKQRLRSFILTNCDTHTNLPPKTFLPKVWLARAGMLAPLGRRVARNTKLARRTVLSTSFEDVRTVPEEQIRGWVEAVFGTPERAKQFQRWIAAMNSKELVAIEPELRRLEVPTLIVWGTADMFFKKRWAYWLRDTIPGATEVIEIDGARLFFPSERAAEFAEIVRGYWTRDRLHEPASRSDAAPR